MARSSATSNIVRDTNTAVNTFASRPIASVVAKPRIEVVPNWNRNAAAISDVTCVSTIVSQTRVKAALTAARGPLRRGQLLLDALEDQHVRIDAHADRQDQAGDARQRQRHRDVGHERQQDQQVQHHRDQRVDAGQAVVRRA